MNIDKVLLTVFVAALIAEPGDKTQLATVLFMADREISTWTGFSCTSLAPIVAPGMGVPAGSVISEYISEKHLHHIAGAGFIGIGIWTLETA